MTPELNYAAAFMAGILGSGHCIGMCGSLVSAFFMSVNKDVNNRSVLPYVAYHGARVGVYTLVGALAALLGLALTSTGIIGKTQGILQIVAGVVVILIGLEVLGVSRLRFSVSFLPARLVRSGFSAAMKRGPVVGSMMGGTLNGFMPCALTLAIAVKATTAGSALEGALLMAAFGAGTLPSMMFVSVLFGRMGAKFRGNLMKAAALIVIVMGVATVYQGVRYTMVMKDLANW